jgi:uncharacterized cupredoxin-like copper-binding protein
MRRLIYAIAMVASAAALLLPAAADASGTVKVSIADFKIKPATSSTSAGKTTFVVKNSDSMEHELVVIKTTRKAGDLPMDGAQASEKGKVGEVEDIGDGQTKKVTLNLKKGHYALICNIPGHYKGGMFADFTVR